MARSLSGDGLAAWRDEFPTVADCTYLVSHSLGAMPRRTAANLQEYAETWTRRGVRAWHEGWWEMGRATGDLLAPILGVTPGSISMHQNVTVAMGIIASCFRYDGARRKIVLTELEFPTNMYLFEGFTRYGAEIACVASDSRIRNDIGRLLDAIDERTVLVPLSLVLFRSSCIQDVRAVIEKAHAVGAHVILDVYQAAGTVPLDIAALQADFAVGGSVKWLCGGPGNGWLYVHPGLAERFEPTATGWQAHEQPFAFEEEMRYAAGAARFLTGTPNVPAHYAATAGYDLIEEIGVERIRAHSLRQTQLLIDLAETAGFEVRSPRSPERRGGTVTVHVPDFPAVHRELTERQILCDFRPDAGIRLGPHFYTSDDELRFAIDQMAEILETGAYERHLGVVASH